MDYEASLFGNWYGDGQDGASPTIAQWQQILELPEEDPVTLINFFKLAERANYGDESAPFDKNVSGEVAFGRYAEVSIPTMERMGGRFLHVGPFAGMFLGADEDWDIIAIGQYPNLAALTGLYSDAGYRAAFRHRSAACAAQKVLVAVAS